MMRAIECGGHDAEHKRARVSALTDHPFRLPLSLKVNITEWAQACGKLGTQIEGQASSLFIGDDAAPDAAFWPLGYLNTYGFTIAAGTSEIQRNILGERVLDLPKSK